MKKTEIGFVSVLLLLSLTALTVAMGYEFTSRYGAGPGFFPTCASALMSLGCIVRLTQLLFFEKCRDSKPFFANKQEMMRLVLYYGSLIVLVVLIEFIGILPSALIYLLSIYRFYEKYSWKNSIAVSIGVVVFFYFTFEVWLGLKLPLGMFE